MAVETTEAGTVITGRHIELFRLKTILRGLKAEQRGMRLTSKGPTCLSIVKAEGIVPGRTLAKAIPQMEELIANWTE